MSINLTRRVMPGSLSTRLSRPTRQGTAPMALCGRAFYASVFRLLTRASLISSRS
jgi:hypothetical protein